MGKQKRKKPRLPVADWSTAEEIALLSYLDHALKHDEVDFKQTVPLYLNRIYTFEQCDRKLWALWNRIGPDHPPGTLLKQLKEEQSIYKHGSACLHGLDERYRRDIVHATEQLENEFVAKQPSAHGPRLRSSSRFDRSQSVQSPVPRNPPTAHRTRARTQFKGSEPRSQSQSITPSLIKQENLCFTSTPSEKSGARKRRKEVPDSEQQNIHDGPSSPDTQATSRKKNSTSKQLFAPSPKIVNDSFDASTDSTLSEMLFEQEDDRRTLASTGESLHEHQNDCVSSRAWGAQGRRGSNEMVRCICGATEDTAGDEGFWISCERCHVWQHAKCVEYFCEECLPCLSKISHNGRNAKGPILKQEDIRLKSALREIEILRGELWGKEADLKDQQRIVEHMEKEKSRMETARIQRDALHSWPMVEDKIANYERSINDLHIELEARQRLSTFAKLKFDARNIFALRKIDEQFGQIHRDSQQIMCGHDEDRLPHIPHFRKNSTLKDLLSKAFGGGDDKTESLMQEIHPQALMRALTNVALKEWVFETDFPQFGNDLPKALHVYRTLILEQDGALALRNLDLAALNFQTNDETFQKQVIPMRSTEFVVKISHVLAPFFSDTSDTPSESDWQGFATWGDDEEIWQARKYRLIEIFTTALTAKADSCLNLEDYEMVIFEPGTKFDKNTMGVETKEGMACIQGKFEGRVVRFCVQAAIYLHPRNALPSTCSVTDAVVPMRNFVRKTERERATIRPLVKAVVILAD